MRIDAHQQLWHIANRQGRWPPPALAPMHRDFVPDDLLPALQRCRIAGTVLLQSPATMSDTEYMLDLAKRHDFILGVVGWIDLKSAGAPVYIDHLARHPQFKGPRAMLQDLADDRWIDDPALDTAVLCMIDRAARGVTGSAGWPRSRGCRTCTASRLPPPLQRQGMPC